MSFSNESKCTQHSQSKKWKGKNVSFCVLANFDCFPVTNSLIKATMGGRQLLLLFLIKERMKFMVFHWGAVVWTFFLVMCVKNPLIDRIYTLSAQAACNHLRYCRIVYMLNDNFTQYSGGIHLNSTHSRILWTKNTAIFMYTEEQPYSMSTVNWCEPLNFAFHQNQLI